MTRITSLDLTPFYRNSVGFNQLFDRITNNIDTASTTKTTHHTISYVQAMKLYVTVEIAA